MSLLAERLSGRLRYGRTDGTATGFEEFTIRVGRDGGRTLNAFCVMEDAQVVRDVILSVAPDWAPLSALVKLEVGGRPHGAGLFRQVGDGVHGQGWCVEHGSFTQHFAGVQSRMFGTHAVMNDGWAAPLLEAMGAAEAVIEPCHGTSFRPDGASGPILAPFAMPLKRFGVERVEVPAGTFEATRYQVTYPGAAPIDFWTTGAHHVLVRMIWEPRGELYELESLSG